MLYRAATTRQLRFHATTVGGVEARLSGERRKMIPTLCNTAWMWQCRPEAARFARAVNNVQRTQSQLLRQILIRNADCEFGRKHRFSNIQTPQQFQRHIPLCSYETLAESMGRIAAGQSGVLTREPVLMFEPTSGTAGPEKLIPYTRSLKRQFQRAISAWAWDTLAKRPYLRQGSSYWSLSPAFGRPRITTGGLSIGFDNDTQYLSLPQRLASKWAFAVNPAVSQLDNLDNFRYSTVLQLLCAANLTMISVWSPTFLLALLANLDDWWPTICDDLSRGTVTWPTPHAVAPGVARTIPLRRDRRRADYLKDVLGSSSSESEKLSHVWPSLRLLSCWTDATAAQFVPDLQRLIPNVEIQSKGLIATEGVVSIPQIDRPGTTLALRSHFFEFQEERAALEDNRNQGATQLAHELELNRTYRVIVTTGGGLYRYQLGDTIQVLDFWKRCPLIRFLGRSAETSDLVGEKLNERHVRESLQKVFGEERIAPSFSMLVPAAEKPLRYILYLQGKDIDSTLEMCCRLATRLQTEMEKNPYYRHAVRMGQLAALQVIVLDPQGEAAWQIFERTCVARGQKLGDIKPVALHSGNHWTAAFATARSASRDLNDR